ncbi:MAG: IS200/IS605 family transposase [Bacteroidetes bacterium]|nr:IS200/IS605 family transposase [Bacteroidota bacterium]MCK4361107.1 IS200/IS605 family transposase [Bacteroidales bacterium]MCK4408322.1 IS200/IS605 family transposase [Bacteroidales bacterium]MCK4639058.1 IS200/IS605 family transposase [Bacteroidales bacterium]
MATYTQILYQIVFSTKNREKALINENREKLYRYIWGILKNKKCVLYKINGVEDHLHIATHIHPTIALSSLVKDIKVSSSVWIKEQGLFPAFKAWQEGYGAFTYSIKEKEALVNYIKKQETHHKTITFREEYIKLLNEHGIEFDEKYLF